MATNVDIDMSEYREFFAKLEKAASGDFKRDLQTFLDGIGNDFLRIVEDEIKRLKVMDSRQLLASFHKDGQKNIWRYEDDGMTLEVGSSVEYAGYVNDGHWTIDPNNPKHFKLKSGELARFVPGHWEGERFVYEAGASGGMVLKQGWVEGKHYFDSALRLMDKMLPKTLDAMLQQWLDKYFA